MDRSHAPVTYTVNAPGSAWKRLAELAAVMSLCRDTFVKTGDGHWVPAPGSAAAQDVEQLPSPDPALGVNQGRSGHALVSDVILTYLQIAAGQLGGLSVLYSKGEVFFPTGMLSRSVLENVARIFWVLGDSKVAAQVATLSEASAVAGGRLVRAYLEEHFSADEAKKALGRMGSKTGQNYQDALADWKQVREDILTRFPGSTLDGLSRNTLAGQAMPKQQDGVVEMFEFLNKEKAMAISAEVAKGLYDFLSNATHPTLYPARDLRVPVQHGNHVRYDLRIDVDFLERQASDLRK